MKKDTDKLITKPNNFLGLILFAIIYFLVQNVIYPLLGFLFCFFFHADFWGNSRCFGNFKSKRK